MDTIRFVDTTLRDGHQSLWAENMTTGMMLPIAKRYPTRIILLSAIRLALTT